MEPNYKRDLFYWVVKSIVTATQFKISRSQSLNIVTLGLKKVRTNTQRLHWFMFIAKFFQNSAERAKLPVFNGKLHLTTTNLPALLDFENKIKTWVFFGCSESPLIGYSIAVGAGLTTTLEILLIRLYPSALSSKRIFLALFWSYTFGTFLSLIIMAIFETPQPPEGITEICLVLLHCCTYVFILPLIMYGSSVTSGNTANVISTSSIIAMLAAQYTILKDIHPGNKNWIEVVGGSAGADGIRGLLCPGYMERIQRSKGH